MHIHRQSSSGNKGRYLYGRFNCQAIEAVHYRNLSHHGHTGIQTNLNILQSLTMDRSLSQNFNIPAASFQVFVFIIMNGSLPTNHRLFLLPCLWDPDCRSSTILSQIRADHIVNQGRILWLVVPLALIAAGLPFYIPGQVSLYYQEIPAYIKNTMMMSLTMGIGFYLSKSVVDVLESVTGWLNGEGHLGLVIPKTDAEKSYPVGVEPEIF
ncbi:hypothetical protein EJ110_NYTH13531 [Nymphaea thermarum]|nr:hypothetical protein EJ110_NYTH13531 [Nymphaea thermarum]